MQEVIRKKDIVYMSSFKPTAIPLSPYSNFHIHHYRLIGLEAYHTTRDALRL